MSQRIGITASALTRVWHHVDVAADNRSLGRLASSIAITLMGKHKPTYTPKRIMVIGGGQIVPILKLLVTN